MRTLRSAAALLAGADSVAALGDLVAPLGFGAPLPLDDDARQALGLPTDVMDARVARGPGVLRALVLEARQGVALRDLLSRVGARLGARSPHLLWLAAAVDGERRHVALASWSADRRPPRVAALVVERARPVESDAETLCALAAATDAVDVLTHARWLDVLGREALTCRFYRTLERLVGALAESAPGHIGGETRRELALLCVSRLLFLAFLEAKGWLDGDRGFLARRFERCMATGGAYHRRVLLPLFFGTLNTPGRARAAAALALGRIPFLNGGLFAPASPERRHRALYFGDAELGAIHGELLGHYRFTAREESTGWSEAAVDPEMLGRAFESLMASRERRASGAYYTPQALVERVTGVALSAALVGDGIERATVEAALAGDAVPPQLRHSLRDRVTALRLLDPACGSGAFLVHALERITSLAQRLGDARPSADVRREVLTRSIFGVDVSPVAVWLCELRLWLAVVIECNEADPMRVAPLPNLDRHIRIGDSLAGGALEASGGGMTRARLERLRERYTRASGPRKRTLARELEREERTRVLARLAAEERALAVTRRERLALHRARDLFGERHAPGRAERQRLDALRVRARELRAQARSVRGGGALPFSFATHFGDAVERGGFDVILGNPPWVRLHRIPRPAREAWRREFRVFRQAAWAEGAARAHAGAGFAAQVDLAALFVERSVSLLRPGGTLALLLPVKLWHSLAGGGVRRLLIDETHILALEDWSESRPAFDAAAYPSLVVARRAAGDQDRAPATEIDAALHRRDGALCWPLPRTMLPLDASPGAPWVLLPAAARAALDRIAQAGEPLARSALGRPLLGVKCGCNAAFVVQARFVEGALSAVRAGDRDGWVEDVLLRPLVRGESLAPWRMAPNDERLLWTHDERGHALQRLPPHAERWLAPWRRRLAARADARGARRWWTLFRVESALGTRWRVVWADLGRTPRAAILSPGDPTVPLNSCYVLPCAQRDDALAVAALLNSPLAAAWLGALAEPARGGFRRFLAWTVALLPIPADWPRARTILAPLAARALEGDVPGPSELLDATVRAYRVRLGDVEPLVTWCLR